MSFGYCKWVVIITCSIGVCMITIQLNILRVKNVSSNSPGCNMTGLESTVPARFDARHLSNAPAPLPASIRDRLAPTTSLPSLSTCLMGKKTVFKQLQEFYLIQYDYIT